MDAQNAKQSYPRSKKPPAFSSAPGCVSDVDVRSTHDTANTRRPRLMIPKRDGAAVFGEKAAVGFWKNVRHSQCMGCCRVGTNYSAGLKRRYRFFTLPFEREAVLSESLFANHPTPCGNGHSFPSDWSHFSFARILLTCVFTVPSLRKSVTPLEGRSANEAVWSNNRRLRVQTFNPVAGFPCEFVSKIRPRCLRR